MAYYLDETEIYKCSQHPSKRRRSGICPVCLKLRLSALCPDCANVRPCSCSTSTSTSSSSSSFSLHFSGDRISAFIDGEPPFRRSRSAAFSFLRSGRFSGAGDDWKSSSPENLRKSMWSVIWWRKPKREKVDTDEMTMKMRRSRSVAPEKGKGWYFPSPMKVFRHTKAAKLFHERSPLHRG